MDAEPAWFPEADPEVQKRYLELAHLRVLADTQQRSDRRERRIIYFQIAIGFSLVLGGGMLFAIFSYTEAVATTIIGAGAALLPAGAAASASARLRASKPDVQPSAPTPPAGGQEPVPKPGPEPAPKPKPETADDSERGGTGNDATGGR